jgi:hypothetical protein
MTRSIHRHLFKRSFTSSSAKNLCCEISIQQAMSMPRGWSQVSNNDLVVLAKQGVHAAREERLRREIMAIDQVEYLEADKKLEEINHTNDSAAGFLTVPFKLGAGIGIVGAVSSVPLVFHKETAVWFNEQFVHTDLPEGGVDALDTFWKVGNWTWGWMEPYLGTASFVLLGFQFTRAQVNY